MKKEIEIEMEHVNEHINLDWAVAAFGCYKLVVIHDQNVGLKSLWLSECNKGHCRVEDKSY